jgi:thiamine-phosphate pyrophosphorylase
MRENLAATLRLLLVTDDELVGARDLPALCREAVRGGVTAVQLRLKRCADRELFAIARSLITGLDVPVFINDRVDIAIAAGACGVHLGPDDLAPALARRIAPAGFIIGASVGSAAEVDRGAAADYWGIGPLHRTDTKPDAGAALELSGATALRARANERPCVVIGGVTPADVLPAMQAGFAGVAVVRGILAASDPAAASRGYSTLLDASEYSSRP